MKNNYWNKNKQVWLWLIVLAVLLMGSVWPVRVAAVCRTVDDTLAVTVVGPAGEYALVSLYDGSQRVLFVIEEG